MLVWPQREARRYQGVAEGDGVAAAVGVAGFAGAVGVVCAARRRKRAPATVTAVAAVFLRKRRRERLENDGGVGRGVFMGWGGPMLDGNGTPENAYFAGYRCPAYEPRLGDYLGVETRVPSKGRTDFLISRRGASS